SSDTRMLSGILRVFAKTRPALAPGSVERGILDRRVTHFEAELAAAEARSQLIRGNGREAARHLAVLHELRGGRKLWLASRAATLAPALALAAYRIQRTAKAVRHTAGDVRHTRVSMWRRALALRRMRRSGLHAVRRIDQAV